MVAGIIVTAVADELTIAHPGGHADAATIATLLGGPALFLAGHALFKLAVFVVLAVLAPVGLVVSPLALATAATVVVAAVAASDSRVRPADLPAPAAA